MSDYIKRQDASNWLKQYGQDVLHGKYKFSLMYIWKNIMELPPADVVSVVRCKDCKHRHPDNWFCGIWKSITDENGYCSYGERREE